MRRRQRGLARRLCWIADLGAAMAVARHREARGHVAAEERNVGAVRTVAHAERAAGAGGIHHRRGRRAVNEIDVSKIERALAH
jgi:hypothetical protein